ncbi:hypothetical protein GCM10011581_14110 [Saccharopolyspora subtropica]|uniref:Secreted protein n=1 Tax=Saccharopolyspora thermophila TaxID=89367 RepID=A0A917JQ88_9PSEU|nr:hypothetical protein [Saccharopolyspora subtropica]GGI78195.1 hypothetical protein GCM10011581_14110 [Saccharopolyspora subtropica]
MRTAKRLLTAVAVGLPLLLGVAGTALADDGQGRPAKAPKASQIQKRIQEQAQSQAAQNHTVQNNINVSPVTQINNGKGDLSAMTWTQQHNANGTEQTESEMQDDD